MVGLAVATQSVYGRARACMRALGSRAGQRERARCRAGTRAVGRQRARTTAMHARQGSSGKAWRCGPSPRARRRQPRALRS